MSQIRVDRNNILFITLFKQPGVVLITAQSDTFKRNANEIFNVSGEEMRSGSLS